MSVPHCEQVLIGETPMSMIGTAGWSIPRDVATSFGDSGSHLERYAEVFPAVEINSSFHRPHRRTTYERWAASVPEQFRFSVKMPKAISHVARLVGTDGLLDSFLQEVGGLGDKLEVLLLQLPPSLDFDHKAVTAFLADLQARLGGRARVACEPRHPTWFSREAECCLEEHKVARVIADPVLAPGGDVAGGWLGLRYRRLHGAPRAYYSSYSAATLELVADDLAANRNNGGSSWCIFDNTASGAATTDALSLLRLADRR